MPNPESKDISLVKRITENASKGTYFGDIVFHFARGEILYFRLNKVINVNEIKGDSDLINPQKTTDNLLKP